jgi:hypothetical protein
MASHEMRQTRNRIVGFLREFEDVVSKIARQGYEESGPGSIFICEPRNEALSLSPTIVYLPLSAPEFRRMGSLAHDLARAYNPRTEYVMVFVSKEDDVYVVLGELEGDITIN